MQSFNTGNGHSSGNSGAFLAGLFMGGLLGAGSMLLLAPQSGKDTRDQIQEEGIELRDQVTETVEGAVNAGTRTGRQCGGRPSEGSKGPAKARARRPQKIR